MANQFVDLPTIAGDGPGAWVDMSSFGALKTITVAPNGGVFSPFINIEISNQDTPTVGAPLATFQQVKDQTFDIACHWMRAVTSNYKGGGAATCAVGGTNDGTSSLQLPVPAGNGLGAGVDVSSLSLFKTVQVAGAFGGTIVVLVSEDGGTTYNPAFSFQGGVDSSYQTIVIAADFMRVQRVGVPLVAPGLPTVWISATSPVGGGGGGGSVDVQKDGVDVVNPASTLNFTGAGVTVTPGGGGIADIAIPGGSIAVTDGTTNVDPTTLLDLDPKFFTVTDEGGGAAGVTLKNTAIIQTARYTADGSETTAGFLINLTSLGIAQPNANYNSLVTLGGVAFEMTLDVPQVDNAPTHIHVLPGANLTAGDVLVVTIIPFVPV